MSLISGIFKLIGTRHFPTVVASNLIFYLLYVCTNTNCWVDFAWAFNPVLLTNYMFFTQTISVSTAVPYALVSLWGLRLGRSRRANRRNPPPGQPDLQETLG